MILVRSSGDDEELVQASGPARHRAEHVRAVGRHEGRMKTLHRASSPSSSVRSVLTTQAEDLEDDGEDARARAKT